MTGEPERPSRPRGDGKEANASRAVVVAIAVAFVTIHAQIFLFPNGFFGVLHADEIVEVLEPRELARAGSPRVLSNPPGHLNGGGIVLGYLLAPIPLESARAKTVAVRGLVVAMAGITLALWLRLWRLSLGAGAGLVPAVLLLFPQEGWITTNLQVGHYGVGALAAAATATLGLSVLGGRRTSGGEATRLRDLALGAVLGAAGTIAPAAAPSVAAVWLVLLADRARRDEARESLAWLARTGAGAIAAAAVLLLLEALATGRSPHAMLVDFVWRPGRAGGEGGVAALAARGFANLFAPSRVWLMPWALFHALLVLAMGGALVLVRERGVRDDPADPHPRPRDLALLHGLGALFTLAPHLITRFADDARWNVTPILPHLVGLAGIALVAAARGPWAARIAALAFAGWWITSGLDAYRERFVVTEPNIGYPAIAVREWFRPWAAKPHPVTRAASTYHWALPIALEEPDVTVCCWPKSLCATECEPGFFGSGPGTFVLPGPAAHAHGDADAVRLAPRLLANARREGIPLEVLALHGRRTEPIPEPRSSEPDAIGSDVVGLIITAADGERALAAMTAPETKN